MITSTDGKKSACIISGSVQYFISPSLFRQRRMNSIKIQIVISQSSLNLFRASHHSQGIKLGQGDRRGFNWSESLLRLHCKHFHMTVGCMEHENEESVWSVNYCFSGDLYARHRNVIYKSIIIPPVKQSLAALLNRNGIGKVNCANVSRFNYNRWKYNERFAYISLRF